MKEKNNLVKRLFAKENVFYTITFIIAMIVIVANRIINGFHKVLWICDVASIAGILNVIFAAQHKIYTLYFNLLSTLLLVITNVYQHIWLNTFTCAAICVPTLIFGIFRWKKNEKKNGNLNELSTKNSIIAWSVYALISVIFIFVLKALGGNVYVFDAIYSAGCVFGVIFSSYAYIDQFKFFTFANLFGIVMYVLLTIQNINNLPLLFTNIIYTIIEIMGYINWRKLEKTAKQSVESEKLLENIEKIED